MTDRTETADTPHGRVIGVPFVGEGAGSGPLSWGQRELWGGMQRQRTWLPVGFVQPLPAGTTVEDVVEDLRFVMCGYPSMRTRLRLDADTPQQVVAASGEVGLALVDAAPDDDPAQVADRIRQHYWDTDYDFQDEWPVRMAVVRHRGEPTHLVWVMCHLVTDAFGVTIMLSELAARDASGSAAAWSPLEQARWQQSPAGQRHSRSALRYWQRMLHRASRRQFPVPARRTAPRYWHASFRSRAADLALRTVTARAGVDDAPVLLAAFVTAAAQVTGVDPVVVRVVVSNRFRPGLGGTVGPINQTGLLVVDAVGRGLEEVLEQVRRKTMATYKHAYYDPDQWDALFSQERGQGVDLGCFFNDRRVRREPVRGPSPTAAAIRAALPETTFQWEGGQDDKPYEPLFVHVEDSPDTVTWSVAADTRYVAPTDLEACVRGMEEVTVAAALGGASYVPADPLRQDGPGTPHRHRLARDSSITRSGVAPAAGE